MNDKEYKLEDHIKPIYDPLTEKVVFKRSLRKRGINPAMDDFLQSHRAWAKFWGRALIVALLAVGAFTIVLGLMS